VSDLKSAFAGSFMGILWVILGPLIFFGFYALVYTLIFPFKPTDMSVWHYILHVFCGISIFLFFSSALSTGSTSLSVNKSILLNTIFPSELIPLRSICIPLSSFFVSMCLLFFLYIIIGSYTPFIILVPFVIFSFLLFIIGLVWIISLLTVLLKDTQQLIGYITMFLLVISPIAYTPSMIPSHLKMIIYLNPLSYYIIPIQDILIRGCRPSSFLIITGFLMGFTLFSIGHKIFEEAKKFVFDYI
jgi:lipopolysaccharide transport system permease protein